MSLVCFFYRAMVLSVLSALEHNKNHPLILVPPWFSPMKNHLLVGTRERTRTEKAGIFRGING